jgi:hypothetical protein
VAEADTPEDKLPAAVHTPEAVARLAISLAERLAQILAVALVDSVELP